MTARVQQWAPMIEDIREDLGITPAEIPTDVMLALIHVESAGDPQARRKRSRYYGLLQIATPYLYDALDFAGEERRHARTLMGDGAESIKATMRYMQRYSHHHEWSPDRIACAHKGGAGTIREIGKRVRLGMPIDDAVSEVAEITDSKGDLVYVDCRAYLERFRDARRRYLTHIRSDHGASGES